MTAYTLSAATNIDALSPARAGGDTVNTNGFKFTIDQDTRYGLGGGATFSLGSLTINANAGGDIEITTQAVRQIPYNTGSGNVPAYNTVVSQGGVTGKLIRVQSAINATPTAVAAAMPASGFITLKQVSGGAFAAGALTGIGASATGADVQGFIELVGDEAATINCNRLGTFRVLGNWYEVGTTSGSSATTYQLPTNGSVQYYPCVYVDSDSATVTAAAWAGGVGTYQASGHTFVVGDEVTVTGASPSGWNVTDAVITAVELGVSFSVAIVSDPGTWTSGGSAKVMEPYPCAGSLVAASSTPTDAVRGKVCWASTAGVLRFGSDGTNTVGYVPPSGRRIRIPSILTANCTTAARGTNALPNATLATRYDFTTTGGGVIDVNKMFLNWYPSFAQAFSVTLKYAAIAEQLSMSEVAQPMTITRCGVGQVAAQAQFALLMSLCFAGGTFNGNKWTSASLAASGRYVQSLTDLSGFTFNLDLTYSFVLRANATTGTATMTRVANSTWNYQIIGIGQFLCTTCSSLTFNNSTYFDCITTTATANPMSVWALASNTINCTFNGLTFGGLTNVQPYTAILSINAAGCANIKLRNIGTSPSSLLSLGSANQTGTVCALATGSAASDVKLQRLFCSSTRTNLYSGDNSATRITVENCMGDYADVPVNNMLDLVSKGVGATPTYAAQTAVYGTHFFDHFTSATVGRVAFLMNETTSLTSDQVTLESGAAFTSAGGLYMPTVGMAATFEMPYYALGHSSFQNSALVMAGGTVGNYRFEYAIDKNDGNGFSAMTASAYTAALLGTALNGLTGIDAALGFKLKLKVSTTTANTTAITSMYVLTNSSAAAQANYYPLDVVDVSVTVRDVNTGAAIENARVRITTDVGGSVVLEGLTNASGVLTGTTQYAGYAVSGKIRRASSAYGTIYKPSSVSGTVDSSTGFSATVLMIPDE